MMTNIKTYSELLSFDNFKDRYNYLKLNGKVGDETFGFERYLNQKFYKSKEWKDIRNFVILRDNGCDLGVNGCEIYGKIIIHHMNPVSSEDIVKRSDYLLNPEYLISTTILTHNAIHYGDYNSIENNFWTERNANDTCLWKK